MFAAIIAVEGKHCLVVNLKYVEDNGKVKQKMTIFIPKSCGYTPREKEQKDWGLKNTNL